MGLMAELELEACGAIYLCLYSSRTLTDPNLGLTLTIPYSTRASPHYLTE